jgi:hypothetical protein
VLQSGLPFPYSFSLSNVLVTFENRQKKHGAGPAEDDAKYLSSGLFVRLKGQPPVSLPIRRESCSNFQIETQASKGDDLLHHHVDKPSELKSHKSETADSHRIDLHFARREVPLSRRTGSIIHAKHQDFAFLSPSSVTVFVVGKSNSASDVNY